MGNGSASGRIGGGASRDALALDSGLAALQASPEFRGTVERLDGHHCNDHLAHVFSSRENQLAALVPFMRQGLERGERCMYVIDETSRETILDAMRAGGIDVAAARESGQLSIHTIDETYLRNGEFDADGMLSFYADAIAEATDSFAALRVAAEATFLTSEAVDVQEFLSYESRVNDLFRGEDCIALCQYDRRRIPAEVIRDVVRTHPHLIWNHAVCHNFYYTPPEEYAGPDDPGRDVDRMLRTLIDRTEAKVELHDRQAFLQDLLEVTASADLGFEEKLQRIFELGVERFDLETGALARVDADADWFEVEHVSEETDDLVPGFELPLQETYCHRATQVESVSGVTDPCEQGYEDVAAYSDLGIRAYLGTFVPVAGGADRTLFFVSSDGRTDPFTEDERTLLRMMGQWTKYVLERHCRERRLAAINRMSRDLMTAADADEIATTTIEYASDAFGLPLSAVLSYDRTSGCLETLAESSRADDELPTATLCDPDGGRLWDAFVADEARSFGNVGSIPGATNDLTELLAIPLGRTGLFVTGTTAPGGFDRPRREFAETVAATVESALARADRERLLQERERTLEEQNERLRQLDRISTTIREIDQSLVQASSREEIESVVCEQLADLGPYELAWIGEYDRGRRTVVPSEWAGTEKGYLEPVSVGGDGGASLPAAEAVATREPQVVTDVLADPAFQSRRQAALTRGFHACMAIPLVYRDSFYGVLELYAGTPDVFDDLARDVLTELSDTVAYAINTVESKNALVSDDVTELEFVVDESEVGLGSLTATNDCTLELESLVPRSDGGVRAYVTTRGLDPTDPPSESIVTATDVALVSGNREDGRCLFEATLTDGSIHHEVLEHGGRIHEFLAEEGVASVTIHLASGADVRQFVETVQRRYPSAELVAQRSRERPELTSAQARKAATEALTDRQLEVLQTAYFSGYFEEPRSLSSREIADRLGISQPTFSTHLRTAQRKLGRQLFDRSPSA